VGILLIVAFTSVDPVLYFKLPEKVNLSAQGCINIHDKAIKEIKSKIENEKIKL